MYSHTDNTTETEAENEMKSVRGLVHHVLQRMGVDGDDSDGGGPLVVLFVVMLVEAGMVEQPERKEDEGRNEKLSTDF